MLNGFFINSRNGVVSLPVLVSILAVVAIGFVLYASYPGYMNPDSVNQLTQIHTGKYSDWHSPFSTLVWAAIHEVIPGPFSFIILINVMIWGGIALLTIVFSRRVGLWSLAILAVPFLPGAFNFLGNVHKDVLLTAWLLAASVSGYMANRDGLSSRQRVAFLVAANLLLAAAFLTRMNSIFALLPILVYVNHRLGWRRNLVVSVMMLVLMPAAHLAILKLTQAHSSHPADSIKTFQLLGLSYIEGENLFPGKWSDEQSKRVVDACYTPIQWDTAALWGKCDFINRQLGRQKLWGSERLTGKWIAEALRHPLGLYSIMSATFHKSLFDPNSRSMFYKPGKSDLFDWEVKTDPPRFATKLVQAYVTSSYNDRLGRPVVFVVIALVALVFLIGTRTRVSEEDLFAITVICSGLIYLLSYLFVTVSAEYRYFYWSAYSIYLGTVIILISTGIKAREVDGYSFVKRLKYALILLLAIAAGSVGGSTGLPPLYRQVSLTPLDERGVTLRTLGRASTPDWMGTGIRGDLSPHDWQVDKQGLFKANSSNGTLTTTLATQGMAIEVEFVTGKGSGRVRIESDGYSEVIDLASTSGERKVYIWPRFEQRITNHSTLWLTPLTTLLYGILAIVFVVWIDSRNKPAWTVPGRFVSVSHE